MNRRERIVLAASFFVLAVALRYSIRARAAGIPAANAMSYSGVLEDANGPYSGTRNVQVTFYDAATGGNSLCQSAPVSVANGRFRMQFPDACTAAVGANPSVFADVLVDGSDTGRTAVGAVPYAVEAKHATSADTANHAASADSASAATHASSADTATSAGTASGALASNVLQRLDGSGAVVSASTRAARRIQTSPKPI